MDALVSNALTPAGLDVVEFLLAPGPADALKPLASVASGGEAARLGLAIVSRGMGRSLGPTAVTMHLPHILGRGGEPEREVMDIGPVAAGAAAAEVEALVNAAEAKATQCLATNYAAFQALAQALEGVEEMRGPQVLAVLREHGAVPMTRPSIGGWGWDGSGTLATSGDYDDEVGAGDAAPFFPPASPRDVRAPAPSPFWVDPGLPGVVVTAPLPPAGDWRDLPGAND